MKCLKSAILVVFVYFVFMGSTWAQNEDGVYFHDALPKIQKVEDLQTYFGIVANRLENLQNMLNDASTNMEKAQKKIAAVHKAQLCHLLSAFRVDGELYFLYAISSPSTQHANYYYTDMILAKISDEIVLEEGKRVKRDIKVERTDHVGRFYLKK
ncbi:MAG: hypothetical protein R3A45_06400 [Bdellovibrionota bacterium]